MEVGRNHVTCESDSVSDSDPNHGRPTHRSSAASNARLTALCSSGKRVRGATLLQHAARCAKSLLDSRLATIQCSNAANAYMTVALQCPHCKWTGSAEIYKNKNEWLQNASVTQSDYNAVLVMLAAMLGEEA